MNKLINLEQLQVEMAVAGVVVNGLGITDNNLHTSTFGGESGELPEGAAAVVEAHVPRVDVDPDAELFDAITASTTFSQLKAALLGSHGGRVKARPGG